MNELNYSLERTVLICAEKATVFRFFTDSTLFADWWGAGSSIEGKPGGKIHIVYPNAIVAAAGEVIEIQPPDRIVFTMGYETGKPMPVGSSLVTVTLKDHPEGTELTLKHDLAEEGLRDLHVQGWKYQLALFANSAARAQHSAYKTLLEDYFRMWSIADAGERKALINRIVSPDVRFKDAYGCVTGRQDLETHVAATQMYMPGMNIELDGEPKQCQGSALARWVSKNPEGKETARGTNLFQFTPSGLISSIVGFWQ